MKRKVRKINQYMKNIESFQGFQNLFFASKLQIGIDNFPIIEDNSVEMSKDM